MGAPDPGASAEGDLRTPRACLQRTDLLPVASRLPRVPPRRVVRAAPPVPARGCLAEATHAAALPARSQFATVCRAAEERRPGAAGRRTRYRAVGLARSGCGAAGDAGPRGHARSRGRAGGPTEVHT